MTKRTVAVVGANGFVGRALVAKLLSVPRTRVLAVGRTPVSARRRIAGARYLSGDITRPSFARRIARQTDTVYYVAAKKKNIAHHTAEAFHYLEGNVRPLLGFLSAIRGLRPGTFVYASSVLTEYADRDPVADGYLLGKRACELALRAFAGQTGWNVKIVRLAAIYGPGQETNPATANFIGAMVHKVQKSKGTLTVWGTGQRKLQFIHVKDAAANLIAASRAKGTLFMVGFPTPYRVKRVAEIIMRLSGKPLRVRFDRAKPDKATLLFRFNNPSRPKITLEKGLKPLCTR